MIHGCEGGARLRYQHNMMIPGGLFVGMGIGLIMDEMMAGILIGLGAGFVLSTIVHMFGRKKK